jgi:hypothetical protein
MQHLRLAWIAVAAVANRVVKLICIVGERLTQFGGSNKQVLFLFLYIFVV